MTTTRNEGELEELFKKEISSKKALLTNEFVDDHSLAIGWAVGKGLKISDAISFANSIEM